MRVMIFGISGLLGKYLKKDWSGDDVTGLDSKTVDIRDCEQVRQRVARVRPEQIVLLAAYTDVDGCELNPDLAYAVNRDGALTVARAARDFGAKLIFLSTDYVFDGTKSQPYATGDPRNPKSVYGKAKAQAEEGILELLPRSCIIRTSWLYGTRGKCFPDTILKLAATRNQLEVVDDQRGSPTYAADLSRAIIGLCRAGAEGIVHVTNAGDCTWFEFANEILSLAKLRTRVLPVSTEGFPRPAPRPKYSVLSPASLQGSGIRLRSWREALAAYLEERQLLSQMKAPQS